MTELGWIDYDVVSIILLSGKRTRWTHTIAFEPVGVGGSPAILDTTIGAVASCDASCAGPFVLAFPQGQRFNPVIGQAAGAAEFDVSGLAANSIVTASSVWTWTFTNPNAANPSTPTRFVSPGHRCDSRLPNQPSGCAYSNTLVTPTHEIVSTRYPAYALHVRLASAFVGAPRFGGGVRLTRTTDESIRARNNATACPRSIPRPSPLFQCDEFPFQSTFEGAASQPFGRTFNGEVVIGRATFTLTCRIPANLVPVRAPNERGGYSVCIIPAAENALGGSDLGDFYLNNRVIEFDTFNVVVR